MTITWRNVSNQEASGAGSLLRTGLNAVNLGFEQLGQATKGVGDIVQERETTALNAKIDSELDALRTQQQDARKGFLDTAEQVNALTGVKTIDLQGGITSDTFKTPEEIAAELEIDANSAEGKAQIAQIMQEAQQGVEALNASNIMSDEEYLRQASGIYGQRPGSRDADNRNKAKTFQADSFSVTPVNDRVVALNEQRIDTAIAGKDALFAQENQRFDFMTDERFADVLTTRNTYGDISDPKEIVNKALQLNIDEKTGKPTNFKPGHLQKVQGFTNTIKKELEDAKPSDFPSIDIPVEIRNANQDFLVTPAALGYALERIGIDQEWLDRIDDNDFADTPEEVKDGMKQEIINFLVREEGYRQRKQQASQNRSKQLEELKQDQQRAIDAKSKVLSQAKTAAGQVNYDQFRF